MISDQMNTRARQPQMGDSQTPARKPQQQAATSATVQMGEGHELPGWAHPARHKTSKPVYGLD
jgi:hypothetical protein